ncbi:MAG: hypothetical protein EBZ13_12530 [Planctomycetia bacterium]|nr:hypothetical protein [Planctomycetia bacterium]
MSNQLPAYDLSTGELRDRVWSRLRRQRSTLALSLGLLLLSVPFVNFHPLVWGFVADHLVAQTLVLGLGPGKPICWSGPGRLLFVIFGWNCSPSSSVNRWAITTITAVASW